MAPPSSLWSSSTTKGVTPRSRNTCREEGEAGGGTKARGGEMPAGGRGLIPSPPYLPEWSPKKPRHSVPPNSAPQNSALHNPHGSLKPPATPLCCFPRYTWHCPGHACYVSRSTCLARRQ